MTLSEDNWTVEQHCEEKNERIARLAALQPLVESVHIKQENVPRLYKLK
jgi:hypothetical protein